MTGAAVRLIAVAGARPHFVKISPLLPELHRAGIEVEVAYTGSRNPVRPTTETESMTFYGVDVPVPRWFLDVGSGSPGVVTGRAIEALENLFAAEKPDAVLCIGDADPTLAAAISAVKECLPVVHLEAGLRCGDLRQPEEVNRVLISRVASMHLSPTEQALENLEDEGIDPERIHFVGSVLAESVLRHVELVAGIDVASTYDLPRKGFVLGSVHSEYNIGNPNRLRALMEALDRAPWPTLVPDTAGLREALARFSIPVSARVRLTTAVSYAEMLALVRDAACVVTDSSGVQVEACMLFTPCVTLRSCTEQTATLVAGANQLCDPASVSLDGCVSDIVRRGRRWVPPKRWDQAVSDRVVRALKRGITPLA